MLEFGDDLHEFIIRHWFFILVELDPDNLLPLLVAGISVLNGLILEHPTQVDGVHDET